VHREGYVANYEVIDDLIRIDLKYYKSASVISDVKRLSKISKRIFLKADKVRLYHSDTSMLLISTSKGLMTSRQAIDNKVGGELILKLS
jgi:small subunit ribosomal protein S8